MRRAPKSNSLLTMAGSLLGEISFAKLIVDWIIDMGPQGGDGGDRIVAAGTAEDVAATKESYTGQYLRDLLGRRVKGGKRHAAE